MLNEILSIGLSEEEQIEKALCERSLHEFMRVFWPVIDGNPFKTGWHIDAICEHIEAVNRNEIRNLVINGPPRSCKSKPISVFYQPWDWVNRPQRSWITAGNTQRLAVGFNYESRLIMRSPKFRRYWGDRFSLSLDNDLKTQFSNDCGGSRLAVGVKTRFIGAGGERKVVDDPHMPGDSPGSMEEVGEWFFGTWRSRTNNPMTAAEIVVMQRLSPYDLVEQIKFREKDLWDFLILPSRFDCSKRYYTVLGWTDPRQEDGELLWPEHIDDHSEKVLRRSLKERADAQMDQDPVSVEDVLYKPENIKYYDRLVYDRENDIVISTTDTGVKSNESSDFSASVIQIKKGNRVFHIDGFAKKVEIGDLIKNYNNLLSRWLNRGVRYYRHLIEDSSNGPALAGISSRRFDRIELVKAHKNKLTRLKAVVPDYEDHKVWFPSPRAVIVIDGEEYPLNPEAWLSEWIRQVKRVPAGSEKDDCPDATAQGLLFLQDLSFVDVDYFDEDGDASEYFFFP